MVLVGLFEVFAVRFWSAKEMRVGVRQVFDAQDVHVIGVIGVHFPEFGWEVAMSGTRELWVSAGAISQFGFEFPGFVLADFMAILAVASFVIAGEGVEVDS